MKKTLFGLLFIGTTLMAQVTNLPVTLKFVKSNEMKIIDIRTEGEWKQMGIIKDAHLITFFDKKSKYDIKSFLKKLNELIEEDEQFAIICNTASRTKLVSNFLGNKLNYDVVNLTGGMVKLIGDGYIVEKYSKKEIFSKEEKNINSSESNTTK